MKYYLNVHSHLPEVLQEREKNAVEPKVQTHPSSREVKIISIDIAKERIPLNASPKVPIETSPLPEYYSVGLHPWSITEENAPKHLAEVALWAENPNVVAIGECGIDSRCTVPLPLQQEVFTRHIAIAVNVRKPLILHLVKATEVLLAIQKIAEKALREKGKRGIPPLVLHGFRGKREQARQLLNKGFYLSFGRYYDAAALHLAYENGHMLLETDELNTPIAARYAEVALLLGIEKAQLADNLFRVGEKLFWQPL